MRCAGFFCVPPCQMQKNMIKYYVRKIILRLKKERTVNDNDDSSANENEQIIQFDFSSEKRSEMIQSENEQ